MLLMTDALARRLEMAEAIDAAGCAEAQCVLQVNCDSAVKPIAGGVAVFCGSESPLTHALCVGMHGPVTAEDLDELEAFFEDREAQVAIDLCPHADTSLRELIADRGYCPAEFQNVMVRELPGGEQSKGVGVEVRPAESQENEAYVRTVIGGFFGRTELTEEEERLGSTLFHMPCTQHYLGFVDGQEAGGGAMSMRNKTACLFADATLPGFRGKGVHSALILARVNEASLSGCDLAFAGTSPGSGSQRNYERLGFQVAYTKVTMVKR